MLKVREKVQRVLEVLPEIIETKPNSTFKNMEPPKENAIKVKAGEISNMGILLKASLIACYDFLTNVFFSC